VRIYHKNAEVIRNYVKKDVELVKKYARVLVLIKSGGEIFVSNQNNWKLDVIAVVGPGTINGNGMFFQEAVLLEVGIGATRPYHNSCVDKQWLNKRRKWFFVTTEQYQHLHPIIFQIIKKVSTGRVSGWETLTWTIGKTKLYYSRKKKKLLQQGVQWAEYPKGVRFSVSKKDELLLADVYTSEIDNNVLVRRHLDGLSKFLDLCLNGYCRNSYTPKQMMGILSGLNGKMTAVAVVLEEKRLLPHHYHWILNSDLLGKKELFLQIIEYLKLTKEEDIHKAGYLMGLSSVKSCQEYGLQLRTISPNLKQRDFLVFEVSIPRLIKEREMAEKLPF